MAKIEWSSAFLTGVEEIDQQHLYLVDLINNTNERYSAGDKKESLEPILDELVDYATYHFATEERIMAERCYPGAPEHSHEHAKFCDTIIAFQREFVAGTSHLSLEILLFLKEWLTTHILQTDKKLGDFLSR